MKQRFYKFLVVQLCPLAVISFLFSPIAALGQEKLYELPVISLLSGGRQAYSADHFDKTEAFHLFNGEEKNDFTALKTIPGHRAMPSTLPLSYLPAAYLNTIPAPDHYVHNLAFFCRQEYKWEKTTKIALRLRIGSLEQCNLLEGK